MSQCHQALQIRPALAPISEVLKRASGERDQAHRVVDGRRHHSKPFLGLDAELSKIVPKHLRESNPERVESLKAVTPNLEEISSLEKDVSNLEESSASDTNTDSDESSSLDSSLASEPSSKKTSLETAENSIGQFDPLQYNSAEETCEAPPPLSKKSLREAFLLDDMSEDLCGVLTLAVNDHLVVSSYLMHMLENADDDTVTELSLLFRQLIFNPNMLKFWFKYQSDFKVLDATIAHIFQGSARVPYNKAMWRSTPVYWNPDWQIQSPKGYFNGTHPKYLCFPRINLEEQTCELHERGLSDDVMSCPCSLGNIDITTLLDFITLQLQSKQNHDGTFIGFKKRTWQQTHFRLPYDKFLEYTRPAHRT